nr:MAG TPA: hypothetical protein [Caudoviricetes sp.]
MLLKTQLRKRIFFFSIQKEQPFDCSLCIGYLFLRSALGPATPCTPLFGL